MSLVLDGIDDHIIVPSSTFNKIVMHMKLDATQPSSTYFYYWDLRTAVSQWAYDHTNGGSGFGTPAGIANYTINGTQYTGEAGLSNVPLGAEAIVEFNFVANTTAPIRFFRKNDNTFPTKAIVYALTGYLGATPVFRYDLTKNTLVDQEAKLGNAVLTGGVWDSSMPTTKAPAAPIATQKITINDRIIDVPIYNPADVLDPSLRVVTSKGIGAYDLVNPTAITPLRVITAKGIKGIKLKNNTTLKVLMIGNSFAQDATSYIHEIAKTAGVNVIFGVLYLSGGSLSNHWDSIQNGTSTHSYFKRVHTNGVATTTTTEGFNINNGVLNENWDIITFQQVSESSGQYNTFQPYLDNLISYVRARATNPKMEIGLHMTWAYATTTAHAGFSNYGNNQMTMYNAIVNAYQQAKTAINTNIVIPNGTVVQNARTNPTLKAIGTELCDSDGYHLNVFGDYLAGLGLFEYLIAYKWYKDLYADVSYIVSGYNETHAKLAKDSARAARNNPYAVTTIA